MAEEETADQETEEPEEEQEISKLEARIEELEAQLEAARDEREPSGAATWAGWILGTLVGATCLALIVAFLGGGLPGPCECPESAATDHHGAPAPGGDMEQQHAALNQFITEHSDDLQTCFDSWASSATGIEPGTVINTLIEVDSDESRNVTSVEIRGDDVPGSLRECLERTVRAWEVPIAGQFVLELPFEVRGPDDGNRGSAGEHPDDDPPLEAPAEDAGAGPVEVEAGAPADEGEE